VPPPPSVSAGGPSAGEEIIMRAPLKDVAPAGDTSRPGTIDLAPQCDVQDVRGVTQGGVDDADACRHRPCQGRLPSAPRLLRRSNLAWCESASHTAGETRHCLPRSLSAEVARCGPSWSGRRGRVLRASISFRALGSRGTGGLTPMRCRDAAPMRCRDAAPMRCRDAAPMPGLAALNAHLFEGRLTGPRSSVRLLCRPQSRLRRQG